MSSGQSQRKPEIQTKELILSSIDGVPKVVQHDLQDLSCSLSQPNRGERREEREILLFVFQRFQN